MQRVTKKRWCAYCNHKYDIIDVVSSSETIVPKSFNSEKEFYMSLQIYKEKTQYADKPKETESYTIGDKPFEIIYINERCNFLACPECGGLSYEPFCSEVVVENF